MTAIESRGRDSSGYAFVKGDDVGVYKNAIPGSQLPLADLPRRAQSVVLHTRFATQGSHLDNRNNHPILSPSGNIALVHNGVISNDWEFRAGGYAKGEFEGLAKVDTAVIPALIEKYGVKKAVEKLEGYAAISWLDLGAENASTLHLARLDYSPVSFTWTTDGTFVFASTTEALEAALFMSGIEYGHVWTMPEETYMTITDGIIMTRESGYKMQEDWYTRQRFSRATTGLGKRTGTVGSEVTSGYGIGSSFGNVEMFDDDDEGISYDEDAAIRSGSGRFVTTSNSDGSVSTRWEDDYRSGKKVTTNPDEAAMAFANESNEPAGVWVRDGNGDLVKMPDDYDTSETDDLQGFYITLDDGEMYFETDVDEVEKKLDWLANLTLGNNPPFPGVEPKLKWTNFVVDIGHVSIKDGLVSWLEDLAQVDQFESTAVYNLDFVRDGIGMLLGAGA